MTVEAREGGGGPIYQESSHDCVAHEHPFPNPSPSGYGSGLPPSQEEGGLIHPGLMKRFLEESFSSPLSAAVGLHPGGIPGRGP